MTNPGGRHLWYLVFDDDRAIGHLYQPGLHQTLKVDGATDSFTLPACLRNTKQLSYRADSKDSAPETTDV